METGLRDPHASERVAAHSIETTNDTASPANGLAIARHGAVSRTSAVARPSSAASRRSALRTYLYAANWSLPTSARVGPEHPRGPPVTEPRTGGGAVPAQIRPPVAPEVDSSVGRQVRERRVSRGLPARTGIGAAEPVVGVIVLDRQSRVDRDLERAVARPAVDDNHLDVALVGALAFDQGQAAVQVRRLIAGADDHAQLGEPERRRIGQS